jgi:hypothetical protein
MAEGSAASISASRPRRHKARYAASRNSTTPPGAGAERVIVRVEAGLRHDTRFILTNLRAAASAPLRAALLRALPRREPPRRRSHLPPRGRGPPVPSPSCTLAPIGSYGSMCRLMLRLDLARHAVRHLAIAPDKMAARLVEITRRVRSNPRMQIAVQPIADASLRA